MSDTVHQLARFLVPCWPLLATALLAILPQKRLAGASRSLAVAGPLLACVLILFMTNEDLLTRWSALLASCIPFLSWRSQADRLTLCLDLLACFALLLALEVRNTLSVAGLTGCGALILALSETLATARARQAWDFMRLRLAGVVLTLLGASLTGLTVEPATIRLGDLFLALGLCLLSGLGTSWTGHDPGRDRQTSLLDMLLCLGAVALMLRLPDRGAINLVLDLAGLSALWLGVLQNQDEPRIHVALASLCATIPNGLIPALLFLTNGLILAADRPDRPPGLRRWMASALPPFPGFSATCGLIAGLWQTSPLSSVLCLMALGIQAARATLFWPDRDDMRQLVTPGILALIGALGLALLGHNAGPIWRAP